MATTSIAGPGAGFKMANTDFQMISTDACDKGQIMAIDISVLSTRNGVTVEAFDTVVHPEAAGDTAETLDSGIFCVALEDVVAGAKGVFRFRGICDVSGGATVASGHPFSALETKLSGAAADGTKVIGVAIEAHSAGGALYRSIFNGIEGFSGKFD